MKIMRRREKIRAFLRTDGEVRQIVARMARSEVKNYLAELAERAEVPFDDPVSCLRNVWNLYQYGKSPAALARDKETFGDRAARENAEFAAKARAADDGRGDPDWKIRLCSSPTTKTAKRLRAWRGNRRPPTFTRCATATTSPTWTG